MPLSDDVIKTLKQKHPNASHVYDTIILHGPVQTVNDIVLDGINAELIRKCNMKTKSSHGPSGLDAIPGDKSQVKQPTEMLSIMTK